MLTNSEKTMDQIVGLCKNRGFIYSGSEIYGGLSNTWDYGPLGVEFKNNVKKAWLKKFVQESPYNVGLDAAILMNPQVWVASGRNRYGLQCPTAHPSRMGTGTRYLWLPWSRKIAPLDRGHASAYFLLAAPNPTATFCRNPSNSRTNPNPYPACRRIPTPSAQIHGYGR